MPTSKPKVSAYVPQAIKDALTKFKDDRGLSSESEALTIILAEHFGIEETIRRSTGDITVGGVTLTAFQELQETVAELLIRVDQLESTDESSVIKPKDEPSSLQLSLPSESLNEITPIPGTKLCKLRFGIYKDAASAKKKKLSTEEFTEWTRKQDPDGITWKFVTEPSKGYVPAEELSSELRSGLLKWIRENLT